jgi:small subunit ribosomal protein S6
VLSSDEIQATAQTYLDMLTTEGSTIIFKNEMGLKQLAYPINKRSSGVYFCFEFQAEDGTVIPKAELALTRDERIMRFLTVRLDKYGVKYNQDKRDGKIGTRKRPEKPAAAASKPPFKKSAPKPSPKPAPKPVAASAAVVADQVTEVLSDSSSEEE